MIIVKIELHSAITGKVTELGRMRLSNTGEKTAINPNRGDYDVELFRKGSTTKVQRKGLVRDYPRQSYTVWELVRRALECTLGKWPIHPGRPEEFDEDVMGVSNGFMVDDDIEPSSKQPDRNGFTVGQKIEPGYISEEFRNRLEGIGVKLK